MDRENKVKEAVEDAKIKAAREEAERKEEAAPEEQSSEETTKAEESGTKEEAEEAPETAGEVETDSEESGEEGAEESVGEPTPEKEEKGKKLFGKKKKKEKDKKDEKIEELTDRLTRQMAEFDNFRKRTEKEKSQMYEIGAKDIIEKILPVVDNFERGLAAVPEEEKDNPFMEGMDRVYRQFMTTLEGIGVKPIPAVGEEFNPDYHNAVMHVEDESLGENVIAEEFQKGYLYRDSVVRHSMVKVAN